MSLVRSSSVRRLVSAVVATLGVFLIPLPSLLVFVTNDAGIPPITVFSVSAGLVLGLPLIGVGIALSRRRYQTVVYLSLIMGAVLMTIVGLVLLLARGQGNHRTSVEICSHLAIRVDTACNQPQLCEGNPLNTDFTRWSTRRPVGERSHVSRVVRARPPQLGGGHRGARPVRRS